MAIDLKSKNKHHKEETFQEYEEISMSYSREIDYDGALYRWITPEHEPYTVGKKFYLLSTLLLIGLVVYALISNSPIMAITFILIGIVGYLFIQKDPRTINFSITHEGITAGNEIYEFENLKSFWIFYNPPYEKKISLHSKGTFTPYIHIPIGDEDPVEIRNILIDFIPEEKQEHTIVDTIEKLLHK